MKPRGECTFLRLFCAARERNLCAVFYCLNKALKGVIGMTLNLLFVTVTFKKKQESFEEAEHNCNVTKQYEQTKTKQHYLSNIY
jgi:uncharacterized protein (TIGR02413 family)